MSIQTEKNVFEELVKSISNMLSPLKFRKNGQDNDIPIIFNLDDVDLTKVSLPHWRISQPVPKINRIRLKEDRTIENVDQQQGTATVKGRHLPFDMSVDIEFVTDDPVMDSRVLVYMLRLQETTKTVDVEYDVGKVDRLNLFWGESRKLEFSDVFHRVFPVVVWGWVENKETGQSVDLVLNTAQQGDLYDGETI